MPHDLDVWKRLYDACLDPLAYLKNGEEKAVLTWISVSEFGEMKDTLHLPTIPIPNDNLTVTSSIFLRSPGFIFRHGKKLYSITALGDKVVLSEYHEENGQ